MIKKENLDLIDIFIVFMLINGFYIHPLIHTTFLAPFIACFYYFFKVNSIDYSVFLSKYFIKFIFFLCSLLLISLSISAFHGTYDFAYAKNFVSQIITLICVVISCSLIFYSKINAKIDIVDYGCRLIVWSFMLQSIIQILAFSNSQIASLVHLTYFGSVIELYEGHGGVRGVSLTGSPGWGLTVGYGIAFLLYTKIYLIDNKPTMLSILYGLLLVIGNFFAGRSGFIGAILSVLMFVISTVPLYRKLLILLFVPFLNILVIALISILFPQMVNTLVEKVFPFVFEFYYAYESTGEIQTGSTNVLKEMWQVPISFETFWLGDGYFMNPFGTGYYMKTDVGILRNILYGGILWYILIVLYALLISFSTYKWMNKSTRLVAIFIFLMLAIFDIKAMTLGFNKYAFVILMCLSFSLYYSNRLQGNKSYG